MNIELTDINTMNESAEIYKHAQEICTMFDETRDSDTQIVTKIDISEVPNIITGQVKVGETAVEYHGQL
jgi:hypothetical protein